MSEKYEFIETLPTAADTCVYPVCSMCGWLSVSRSGFYDWRTRPASATAERRADLKVAIEHFFDDSDQTYGYRRSHAELAGAGVQAGPELVRQLIRELELVPGQPRPFRYGLTAQDADQSAIPDLLERDFTATTPGTTMVGDITYVPHLGGMGVRGDGDRLLLHEGHRWGPGRQLPDAADRDRDPACRTERDAHS